MVKVVPVLPVYPVVRVTNWNGVSTTTVAVPLESVGEFVIVVAVNPLYPVVRVTVGNVTTAEMAICGVSTRTVA